LTKRDNRTCLELEKKRKERKRSKERTKSNEERERCRNDHDSFETDDIECDNEIKKGSLLSDEETKQGLRSL